MMISYHKGGDLGDPRGNEMESGKIVNETPKGQD